MSLIQLIYVSTATTELEESELDAILESSARHNTPQDVTGMLLYSGGTFMQVLEGEEAAVDETYQRICADPRHHSSFLLTRDLIKERNFAAWSMGFRRLNESDATAKPSFAPFFQDGFDARTIGTQPGIALDLLLEFSQRWNFK